MHGGRSQDLSALMSQIRYLRVNIAHMSGGRQAVSRRAMPWRPPLAISAGAVHTPGSAKGLAPAQELNDGADFATMLA
jgi:hypothetical protein